jgi:hypothetical protein
VGKLKGDLDEYGRIILKWALYKYCVRVWADSSG